MKADWTRAGRIWEISRIPKIHCLVRSRSSGMGSVVGLDNVRGVGKFVGRDPFIFFIRKSFPGYEVFNFSSMFSRGKDFLYLLFFYFINDVRRWRRRNLLRGELDCMVWMEKTFMEDWVDSTLSSFLDKINQTLRCVYQTTNLISTDTRP